MRVDDLLVTLALWEDDSQGALDTVCKNKIVHEEGHRVVARGREKRLHGLVWRMVVEVVQTRTVYV